MNSAVAAPRSRTRCASADESKRIAPRAALMKRRSVRKTEHTSSVQAKNSCDLICLRVKRNLKFGCSISGSNKRRSITELNSDSHSQKSTVENKGRQHSRTIRSCGRAPSEKKQATFDSPQSSLQRDAGLLPAFAFARALLAARRAEFISVSGFRAARSALLSDLRLKRTSGVAAATSHLHAPMNSPDPRAPARPGFHQPVCINC